MSLLFKTDVVYTGIAQAKHILELLITPQDKLDYMNKMLSSVKATSNYLTINNADDVVTSLLSHVRAVQSKGAKALSLPYTLKAIIFVMQHGLQNSDFIALSPDFGVSYSDVTGNVLKIYSLNGGDFYNHTEFFSVGKPDGFNVLRNRLASPSPIVAYNTIGGFEFTNGIILGNCVDITAAGGGTFTELRDIAAFNTAIGAKLAINATASSSNATISIPTTSENAVGYSKQIVLGDQNSHRAAGVVSAYHYGSVDSKIFFNGSTILANTESSGMLSLSSKKVTPVLIGRGLTSNIIEMWFIDSNSDSIAVALSNHLNRKNMLQAT